MTSMPLRSAPALHPSPLAGEQIAAGYGERQVLAPLSLALAEKRLTVLVGPNGSGKSTLLSLLARLLRPTQGTVLLRGEDIHRLPPREVAKTLGLLPQSPPTPEGLKVHELVARGRSPHHGLWHRWTDADDHAIEAALAATGLLDLADCPVEQLSGGQRQRCFIALVLAQDTPIILFDEPTSYLDLRYQVEVMDVIASLPRTHGRTVVTVLHDLNSAMHYADHLIFLKNGEIRALLDSPKDCTPALIEEVFETPVVQLAHPQTGSPIFVPHARKRGWR